MQGGASPWSFSMVIRRILKVILSLIGSQYMDFRTGDVFVFPCPGDETSGCVLDAVCSLCG